MREGSSVLCVTFLLSAAVGNPSFESPAHEIRLG